VKFKYLILSLIIVCSFYLTDKVMNYIDNRNPIMKEILNSESKYNVKSVNAIIKDNTIIPGINGKTINEKLSLIKMEDFGSFNETFLVFNTVTPKISINNNKDKVIIKGNSAKRSVTLVLDDNELLKKYLINNQIKFDIITKIDTNLNLKVEYINGESLKAKYDDLESILKKNKLNNNLCLINYSNLEECKNSQKYLINYFDYSNPIESFLNKIESGSIILINKEMNITNLKLIINEIKRQDLKIVYLSQLIDEKN
jgi:hypothetical protein